MVKIAFMNKDRVSELTARIVIAKSALESLQQSISEMETELKGILEESQTKSTTLNTAAGRYQVTYVQSERVTVDEVGLRKSLGGKIFDSLTDKKLNRKKLEAALDNGDVDVERVSPYVSSQSGSAYIRYTLKKEDDEA